MLFFMLAQANLDRSGERKGTNKYYPPDFDPKIHKTLSRYHGIHPLRDRGQKASEGIIKIRFEMPYNCWCLTCKNPIGMGVRYNAEKIQVGMYHSTPIFKFKMPCHLCAGTIEIQTDPQNFDYVLISGARRKDQIWEAEDNEQIVMSDFHEKKKLAMDAMYQVEHSVKDKSQGDLAKPALEQLELDKNVFKDDFAANQLLRKKFREVKRLAKEELAKDNVLLNKLSLVGSHVKLLPEQESDEVGAKLIRLTHTKSSRLQ
ncbi:unnamed protein product [Protopolystoma xenopodis]|uniref:Uncharacterized protein n=1 Tax=Protopolystoma xenopodis TaxID=117903 RepID=A0A448XJJ6_9PLAT|nr:unnamed protein product [Protopolystoma xenopodis]